MSNHKTAIYGGIVVALILAIGGAHYFSSHHAASASADHVTTINVAGVTANRPYTFADHGKIGGYEGELLQKIDKDLPQYKFKYSTVSQNSAFVGLQSGKYDLSASGYWSSKERTKTYLQSDPDAIADLRLVYRQGEGQIKDFRDLSQKGLKLAPISSDDARYSFVADYNAANPKHKVTLTPIGDITSGDALKQLQEKQFDAVFYPYQAYFGVKDAGGAKGLTVSPTIALKNDHFFLHKSAQNKKLNHAINQELAKLKRNGYLEKLSKKWLGEDVYTLKGADKTWNDKNN